MTAVILTLHTLIVLGLIVVVLLQRSDGGALGLGGGGGAGGGFMTGRGAANALTRTTSILAALFFATSLGLAIRAGGGESEDTIIDELTGQPVQTEQDAGPLTTEDLLGTLGGDEDGATPVDDEGAADLDAVLDSLGTEPAPAEPVEENTGDDAPATPDDEQ